LSSDAADAIFAAQGFQGPELRPRNWLFEARQARNGGGRAVAARLVLGGLVSLPLGIFVAYALARWRFPGRQVLNGLVHLPLILPPVVTGYLLLLTFGRRGLSGAA
jgi:hypothetical protein